MSNRPKINQLFGQHRSFLTPNATSHEGDAKSMAVGGLTYLIENSEATLVGYTDEVRTELIVPDEVDSAKVVRIADSAFEGLTDIESVETGASLREIGKRAFAGCAGLHSVTLHDGLQEIQKSAFSGCSSLEQINLPESVSHLGSVVFKNCSSLSAIELPEKLTVLNKGLFESAIALESVGLPYGLQRIGMEVFKDCSALRSLYYYSMRGISDVMVTDRELKSEALPTMIEYLGVGAFQNCRQLRRIDLPRQVVEIPARAFSGCSRLVYVGLHNRVSSVGTRAFRGCIRLEKIRVPFGCRDIGEKAFSSKTTVIASKTSYAASFCTDNEQTWRPPSSRGAALQSAMIPRRDEDEHKPFYTHAQLTGIVERFEIRKPSYRQMKRVTELIQNDIPESRFDFDGTVYRGKAKRAGQARVMVVGDLMSRFRQQRNAALRENGSFDFSFQYVRDLFDKADFVTGNLETMVSPTSPYTLEMEHVDARPHLNAPENFLASVRRAGVDCVTNAQNHVYDAGTRGVLETLDAVNKSQLIHTGVYVSARDQRFVVVDIDGIKVGIVAYMDSARQMMKKANFTKAGLSTMFPYFDEEKITLDIANARAAGAEFVIANCHWGREYTAEITDRQREFARRVVEAGADYIVGAHSHCIQPYEVLSSSDGRRVPCIWSAGNFISDINLQPPITRDTLVIDLLLARGSDGQVQMVENTYHPCRIMNLRAEGELDRDYAVVPTSHDLGGSELNDSLYEAQVRIMDVVGPGLKLNN